MKFGYARVSSNTQDHAAQVEALKAAGCERIFSEKASGKSTNGRPELEKERKAISRGIRILVITTTNLHDLERTALLAPVLNHVNCVGKSVDEGRGDHCGYPSLAAARPIAVERRSGSPPQCRRELPSTHTRTRSFRRIRFFHLIQFGKAAPSTPAPRQACPGPSHYEGSTSAFGWWVNDIRPAHWGLNPV